MYIMYTPPSPASSHPPHSLLHFTHSVSSPSRVLHIHHHWEEDGRWWKGRVCEASFCQGIWGMIANSRGLELENCVYPILESIGRGQLVMACICPSKIRSEAGIICSQHISHSFYTFTCMLANVVLCTQSHIKQPQHQICVMLYCSHLFCISLAF